MNREKRKTLVRKEVEKEIRQRMEDMSCVQLRRLLAFARGMKTKRSGS